MLLADNYDLLTDTQIDSRIGIHDSNHLEVKLDYRVDPNEKAKYRVESYFFIPANLGISKQSYGSADFYSDVQGYIRFKTPSIDFRGLTNNDEGAPLGAIRDLISKLRQSPRERTVRRQLAYELRMFGCVARAYLRDQVDALLEKLRASEEFSEQRLVLVHDAQTLLADLLADSTALVREWRSLRSDFVNPLTPGPVRETYEFVDEFLSLVLEVRMTTLLQSLDALTHAKESFRSHRSHTKQFLLDERNYRSGAGYPSATNGDNNERLVFRRGMLKKFVMSVLWLEISKEKEGRRVAQLGAGIAAGVAMLFTVIATILHMKWFVLNTAGFVAAVTITYVLKDRIKDVLKGYFNRKMTGVLADYNVRIRDPISDTNIGRCREAFSYVAKDSIPESVLKLRHRDAKVSIETLAKPEVVLKYEKAISLEGEELRERMHLKQYDINDIIRFSLAKFLERADDPRSVIPVFDEEEDRVVPRKFRKVYHLNVVMLFHTGQEKPMMKKLRVVFDKKSIRRVEE